MLNDRQAARVGRGFANYRRVQLLRLVEKKPNMAVGEIARQMKIQQPTVTEHVKKLIDGGLVSSQPQANRSLLTITDRGLAVLKFLADLA